MSSLVEHNRRTGNGAEPQIKEGKQTSNRLYQGKEKGKKIGIANKAATLSRWHVKGQGLDNVEQGDLFNCLLRTNFVKQTDAVQHVRACKADLHFDRKPEKQLLAWPTASALFVLSHLLRPDDLLAFDHHVCRSSVYVGQVSVVDQL